MYFQFVDRLEEERQALEAKFAQQIAEQQRLAAEKSEVEEALRLRIQDLERVANREEKEQQQRQAEQEKEEDRLSKVSVAIKITDFNIYHWTTIQFNYVPSFVFIRRKLNLRRDFKNFKRH